MTGHRLALRGLLQELENGFYLGEALLFPEVSRLHDSRKAAEDALFKNAAELFADLPILHMHCRRWRDAPEDLEIETWEVPVAPPRPSLLWRRPVPVRFHGVRWRHGTGMHHAYVPVLGLEVVGRTAAELAARIPGGISEKLLRMEKNLSPGVLPWLARCRKLHPVGRIVPAPFPDLKTRCGRRYEPEPEASVLEKITDDLTKAPLAPAFEMDDIVLRLAEVIAEPRPASILMIGPSGVGKTAAIHETVRRRKTLDLGGLRIRGGSGARMVAGQSGFGMWQEQCRRLCGEAKTTGTVLVLGNLPELMDVGKSEHNPQGVAGFLRSHIQGGDLRIIVECTPDQLPAVERKDPLLLDQFTRIEVSPPSVATCRAILRRFARNLEEDLGVGLDDRALDAVLRLHQRFAAYSALPGRPLRFLESLMRGADPGAVLAEKEVVDAFSRETGLPGFMLDDRIPLDLDGARRWFSDRVAGQSGAVDRLADQLALIKTGLSRTGKPMASLLFTGPTGVGKTELAKALAAYLFGDPDRMIRFDMSEYAAPYAVERLIGAHAGKEGLLTARVREQPFSVVLLDELEKGHPLLFDLLLQVLGEGRLTDRRGRTADFTTMVVILTSNLGSRWFGKGPPGFGEPDAAASGMAAAAEEVRAFFRPELLNRLDRIVPFHPLSPATLHRIAQGQIDGIARRDGFGFHGATLSVAPEVVRHLAEKAHSPLYGARPLRRSIEREVLAPLSEKINEKGARRRLRTEVVLTGEAVRVRTVDLGERRRETGGIAPGDGETVEGVSDLRRTVQQVLGGEVLRAFGSDIYRFETLERAARKRLRKGGTVTGNMERATARLPAMRSVRNRFEAVRDRIWDAEERLLLGLYDGETDGPGVDLPGLEREWRDALVAWHRLRFEDPDRVILGLHGDGSGWFLRLGREYHRLFGRSGLRPKLFVLKRDPAAESKDRPFTAIPVKHPDTFFQDPPDQISGLLLEARGSAVYPLYGPESGLHVRPRPEKTPMRCLVHTGTGPFDEYVPPQGILRRKTLDRHPLRRSYELDRGVLFDPPSDRRFPVRGRTFDGALEEAAEAGLRRRIQEALLL